MLSILLAQATDTVDWGTTTAASDAAASATGVAIFGGLMIFWLLVGALSLALWIWALVDVLKRKFPNESDRTLWLTLVIVGLFVGQIILPIIYLIVGRKKGTIPAASKPAGQ